MAESDRYVVGRRTAYGIEIINRPHFSIGEVVRVKPPKDSPYIWFIYCFSYTGWETKVYKWHKKKKEWLPI